MLNNSVKRPYSLKTFTCKKTRTVVAQNQEASLESTEIYKVIKEEKLPAHSKNIQQGMYEI